MLLIDATCTPADMTYPTDLNLLNDAREKTERIIDDLHATMPGKVRKPRTYRKKTRRNFLGVSQSPRNPKPRKSSPPSANNCATSSATSATSIVS